MQIDPAFLNKFITNILINSTFVERERDKLDLVLYIEDYT